jgi:hypothetical protein
LGKVEEVSGNLKGEEVSGTNLKFFFFQFQIKFLELPRHTRDSWSEAHDPVHKALDLCASFLKRNMRLDLDHVARDPRICPDPARALTHPRVSPYKRATRVPRTTRPMECATRVFFISSALSVDQPVVF